MKFIIWRDNGNLYRLSLKGGNGEIIFTTEGYAQKASAEHARELVRSTNVLTATEYL